MFMAIIRSPHRLCNMVAMKRYGVLGNYIPAFGQIIGLMQYDNFHIYTVDAHTLLLIRNLNRFKTPGLPKTFLWSVQFFSVLHAEILSIYCAIFHDIAKGH